MMPIEVSSTDDMSIYSNEYHMIEELIVHMEKNSYQLPQNFIFLQNLKNLTLYNYEFAYFHEDISYLLELVSLGLHNIAPKCRLPKNITEIKNLKTLELSEFNFEHLPNELAQIPSLTRLFIDITPNNFYNILSELPLLHNIIDLSLFCYDFDYDDKLYIPESFTQMENLEVLDLGGLDSLTSLPDRIDRLKKLRKLIISDVEVFEQGREVAIKSLPDSLCELNNLETLDISACRNLTKLPENFSQLSTLKYLNIFNSGITNIQLTDEQLNNLETLWMQGTLPDLEKAKHLKNFAWRKSYRNAYSKNASEADLIALLPNVPSIETLQLIGGDYDNIDFIFNMPNLKNVRLFCRPCQMPSAAKLKEHGITITDCLVEVGADILC